MNRRRLLTLSLGVPASTAAVWGQSDSDDLITSINQETLWRNRDGAATTWFHPRACLVPDRDGDPFALMTVQEISGSDYFGPVHWSQSRDLGKNWTAPAPIESLGRRPMPDHPGLQKGVCDVVPQYHHPTDTTLAMGHVVFYRGDRFSKKDQLPRYPLYAVRKSDGSWTEQRRLEWKDPRGAFIYTNNCGQRHVLPSGDILLAFTFGAQASAREVAGVRCAFDGETLEIIEVGPALTNPVGRGLLEPSMVAFDDRFFLTIRAEDERGYVSVSEDGLDYPEKKAWAWDDGEPLEMSTTQQHWLAHSDALYLVYTRKDPRNVAVTRWRSPLWMAQVDTDRLCLLRETERVVIPLEGDGINDGDGVPLMGNFNVTHASPDQSWVTVGEWLPRRNARGNTRLARINWSKPNRRPLF